MTKQDLIDLEQLAEGMRRVGQLVRKYFYAKYKSVSEERFEFKDWYFEQFNNGEERIAIVFNYCRNEDTVYVTFDELIEFSNKQD